MLDTLADTLVEMATETFETDWVISRSLPWGNSLADILAKIKAETLGDMKGTAQIDRLADTLAETETETHFDKLGYTLHMRRLTHLTRHWSM